MKEEDCCEMNLICGEIKDSDSDIENMKNFIKRWEEKIKEIKKLPLDNVQTFHMANDFIREEIKFLDTHSLKNRVFILDQLGHDLYLALFIANNNYKEQFPSLWNHLTKLKLPPLNFNMIKK